MDAASLEGRNMSIPITEQRILQIQSGNICAFPGCGTLLVKPGPYGTGKVLIGEMAHIVSETPDGPRGKHVLPEGEHNKHPNLILLCSPHHTEIDTKEEFYTVERLREMKRQHEDAVERAVIQAKKKESSELVGLPFLNEVVHSTLLPVVRMPRFIYSAPCKYGDAQQKEAARDVVVAGTPYLCPFIIREGGVLFAFNDLHQVDGPFRNVVDPRSVERTVVSDWVDDPDRSRWLQTMLNRTLNKLTGRKQLQLDRQHHRYFFAPDEPGKSKTVRYRPLNQTSLSERNVVWNPVRRKTGEPRSHWKHLAVGLQFLHVGNNQWCFCIRPEMRITKDGLESVESDSVGSHVTRHTAHKFNYDLLEDVNFWRDYLSDGKARIILRFGQTSGIAISTTLMPSNIQWPGIPEKFAKPFANVHYEDDLFSSAEFQQLQTDDANFSQEIEPQENQDGLSE